MQVKFSFRKAAELGIFLTTISALVLAGCGGGSSSSTTPITPTTPTTQTYTASAGVGEVLQFTLNKTDLTYIYKVIKTSYAASGVSAGQTASGVLISNGGGFYTVSASSDSFIQDGKLLPINDGLLGGHVRINSIGGANRIPVFGVSNPITQLASLAGTYNFQGFACGTPGIANVTGNPACSTNFGTMSIDTAGNVTKCNNGDITTSPATNPCSSTQLKTIQVIAATPGVFDFVDSVTGGHAGWFFAYTAANGQKVAVVDNDDAVALKYGHAVLSTYTSAASGVVSGNYFKNDNEGGERIVTINNTAYSNDLGFVGTISYNTPWTGFSTFSATSGVTVTGLAMTTGSGAFTHQIDGNLQSFASGLKY